MSVNHSNYQINNLNQYSKQESIHNLDNKLQCDSTIGKFIDNKLIELCNEDEKGQAKYCIWINHNYYDQHTMAIRHYFWNENKTIDILIHSNYPNGRGIFHHINNFKLNGNNLIIENDLRNNVVRVNDCIVGQTFGYIKYVIVKLNNQEIEMTHAEHNVFNPPSFVDFTNRTNYGTQMYYNHNTGNIVKNLAFVGKNVLIKVSKINKSDVINTQTQTDYYCKVYSSDGHINIIDAMNKWQHLNGRDENITYWSYAIVHVIDDHIHYCDKIIDINSQYFENIINIVYDYVSSQLEYLPTNDCIEYIDIMNNKLNNWIYLTSFFDDIGNLTYNEIINFINIMDDNVGKKFTYLSKFNELLSVQCFNDLKSSVF